MPAPHTLRRATGNFVVGDQFWDRTVEMALFTERLQEGAHILLTAPRRIGKTSLLKEFMGRNAAQWLCLYIDLQKAASPPDAVVELSLAAHQYQPVWDKVKSVFSGLAGAIENVKLGELSVILRGGLSAGNWQSKADQILDVLAAQDQPVVWLLDEVAILVNRMMRGPDYQVTPERVQDVDAFLSWIRAAAIRHQGKLRIVITGSIGMEPLVRQVGLSATLNNFTPFHLEPWTSEIAEGCLAALARQYQISFEPGAVDSLLTHLGVAVPHHVQMFFDHLYQAARLDETDTVTVEMVERVYRRTMLGTRGHVELSHMEERLKQVLGPSLETLALDLLTEAAVAGHLSTGAAEQLATLDCPTQWRSNLRTVIEILEHDGYLQSRDGGWAFASGLLKDWWAARFKLGYIPVSKRGAARV